MRQGLILALTLALLAPLAATGLPLIGATAFAQESTREIPPLPRPRPDPDNLPAVDAVPNTAPAPQTPATEAISALTTVVQPVSLSASITPDGELIPNGLVWRIFGTTPDASGELQLVTKSEDAVANVELAAGTYVVHLAYGRAQISENLTVDASTTEHKFVLEAGALRLNAAVTGDVLIPVNLVKFDILTAGDEASRTPVADGLAPNDIVTLNAGTYHVVSYFGDINAVVRADLKVEPGQLTDATLYHRASQVSFKLVSESGGEAIADVEWTVQDADGKTIFSDLGAFPATVLAEGDYTVLAKQGASVFNRDFQVTPGPAKEIEVLTSVY